jgi:hypothetical protein
MRRILGTPMEIPLIRIFIMMHLWGWGQSFRRASNPGVVHPFQVPFTIYPLTVVNDEEEIVAGSTFVFGRSGGSPLFQPGKYGQWRNFMEAK